MSEITLTGTDLYELKLKQFHGFFGSRTELAVPENLGPLLLLPGGPGGRGCPPVVAAVSAALGCPPRRRVLVAVLFLGGNSIENFWLEFWIEIPYTNTVKQESNGPTYQHATRANFNGLGGHQGLHGLGGHCVRSFRWPPRLL